MATKKAKPKSKKAGKKNAALDLGKYMDQIKIGNYTWDDVLKSTSKNMDAVADANRAIIDGYTDIAKRQYAMLKDLLDELRKVSGDRDVVVKELKKVLERARKDLQTLQKMANKTNTSAQRIVQKRADANLKAWKKLVAQAKKAVSEKKPAAKKAATKKKAAKKKAASKRKAAPRKKAAAKRKAAPKKKVAKKKVAKKKAPAKRKSPARKKAPAKRKAAPRKKAAS